MKFVFRILLVLMLPAGARAQFSNHITGSITDSVTGNGVPYATITLATVRDSILRNSISDSSGYYLIKEIPHGFYKVIFSAVGYHSRMSGIISVKDSGEINLGRRVLQPENGSLPEVILQGNRPLVKESVDGFVYNAENDAIAAGSTAADLLRKIPMLTLQQNGAPLLRGSANIRVFIDDKPSDLYAPTVADALKQLPADDIVRIEVVLYPSAKYDAEGTDGVINIITRKTRFNAITGTLRAQLGNRNNNFTPSLGIRKGRWVFNINTGLFRTQNFTGFTLNREEAASLSKNSLAQRSETVGDGVIAYSGLSTLFVLNDLHVINAGYRYRYNRYYNTIQNETSYSTDDSVSAAFVRTSDNISGNSVHTFNLGYNGKSRNRKQQFSLLALYFSQRGVDTYSAANQRKLVIDYRENLDGTNSNSEFSLQADYTNHFTDKLTADAGFKSSFRIFDNNYRYEVYDFAKTSFEQDENRSSLFRYHRGIYAVYSNVTLNFRGWQVRAGARYEQTLLNLGFKDTALNTPDYKNLIPAFLLSRTFAEKHTLKWSYGKRIQRPMGTTNPAINYIDSFNIQTGNPSLQPEITHRYEISYTYNGKKVFALVSLFFNSTHNAVEQVRLPFNGSIYLNTYRNIGKNDQLGLSLSLSWKCTQKLTVTSSLNLRRSWLESSALLQSNSGYQGGGNLNLAYAIGKGFSAEAFGYISSPDIILQGKRDIWKYYGLVISRKFRNDKLSISARIENFLSHRYQYMSQRWSSPLFTQQLTNHYENFYGWFSASWKFGKKEVKAPSVRTEPVND